MRVCFAVAGAGLLVGCGGSGSDALIPLDVVATSIHTFAPKETLAVPNQAITFRNSDFNPHSVTADGDEGPSSDHDLPDGLMPNETYTFIVPAAAEPGTKFYFHDRFDGAKGNGTNFGTGMVGVITVR